MCEVYATTMILDWVRTGASILVPFAAVYFATTKARINALNVFRVTTEDRATRVLKAMKYEVQADIKLFIKPVKALHDVKVPVDDEEMKASLLPDISFGREIRRDIYKESVQYMGVYETEGPAIVSLYGEMKVLKDSINELEEAIHPRKEIEQYLVGHLENSRGQRRRLDIANAIKTINSNYNELYSESFDELNLLLEFGELILKQVKDEKAVGFG